MLGSVWESQAWDRSCLGMGKMLEHVHRGFLCWVAGVSHSQEWVLGPTGVRVIGPVWVVHTEG